MSDPKISLIAAVADNGVIGTGNGLPWRIKSEMKYFKETTMGHPVIHGRKSYETLNKPLPGRTNIIVTRDENYKAEGAIVTHTIEDAIKAAKTIAQKDGKGEIFVLGGAEIYKLALPLADKIYYTEIHMNAAGDVRFPAFDREDWHEVRRETREALPDEDAGYTITVLERKR